MCGIIIEPTSGKNGVHTPPRKWWTQMKKAKKALGFKVIFDEVVCGFFRTGKPFGFQHHNIKPDAVCMAKAITGGFTPFGAVFFSENITRHFDTNVLSAGLTNYAHPLGVSAALSVLDIIHSSNFKKRLNNNLLIASKFCANNSRDFTVRMNGLLFAIELKQPIDRNLFLEAGMSVIVNKNNLILAPSLNCSTKLLSKNLDKVEEIIRRINREKNVLKKTG